MKKATLQFLAGILVGIFVLGGALYVGYRLGQQDPHVVTVKNITNIDDPEVKADFGVFWQAWESLREKQIDGAKATEKNLIYGAISGLARSFKDPYTVFFPPPEAKKFEQDVSGSFGGIGAEIGMKDNQLVVIAPLKNSPAERAGLKAKDKILKIGDTVTDGLSINDAINIIRGEIGTKVTLTIFREGWDRTKEFTIVREEIKVPTVDSDVKEGNILHLKLYAFNENAPVLFHRAVVDGLLKGAQGMVLDMRNNPGGFLEVAVNLAGWFLPRGSTVVSEHFRSGPDNVFRANGNQALKTFPVVVLVNGGSASASEILAGALRDVRGIKLVGEKTFGKGTVQELAKLTDGSSLKITIAKWLLPSGKAIDKNGIVPDFEVKITDKDKDTDPQLAKAIEVLKEQISH